MWPHQLRYTDAFSTPYTLDVTCLSRSVGLELKALIGQPVGVGVKTQRGQRRWVSGLVQSVRTDQSAGGFTPIQLRVRSILSLLESRHTCRVFQDQSVPQIVATILDEHRHANPVFAASFEHQTRFQGPAQQKARPYCVQYNESDAQFIHRLLAEEGLGYSFEFVTPDSVAAARHRLVLFDSPHHFPRSERRLRYRAPAEAVGDEENTLFGWDAQRSLIASATTLTSYDYRQADPQVGSDRSTHRQGEVGTEAALSLTDYTAHSPCDAYDFDDLGRYARLRQEAREFKAKTFIGDGRFRDLPTGQRFVLEDHPGHQRDPQEQRDFLVTGQQWTVTNNLPQGWDQDELARSLARLTLGEAAASVDGDNPLQPGYRSRFTAVRRGIALVPEYDECFSKPTAPGGMTATVVGPQGDIVHTDPLGRIRIQFHWQRADEHPGGTANFDQRSSNWVRVALPGAGIGSGHQFLPRMGQEVLVTFLNGDIDRPIVTGVIYNGRHAPPGFSGRHGLPGNRTLSGIRTQEHNGRGYNELVFDDTPGQVRARLASTHAASELNLGKLVTPRTQGEARPRGEGIELRTAAAIAMRAAQGFVMNVQAMQSEGHQLDRDALLQLLAQCEQVFQSVGSTAGQHGGQTMDAAPQQALTRAVKHWPGAEGEGQGSPVIALHAEAGIASATPKSQVHYAGQNMDTVAQQHLQLTSGQSARLHAGHGIGLFAQGGGASLIAHKGKLTLQAQDDELILGAQRHLQLSASNGEILIAGRSIRLISEDGSYIRIGDGIKIGSQGAVKFHAAEHDFTGPATEAVTLPTFAPAVCEECLKRAARAGHALMVR
jgi:type VI secretion system secreted protein VgrG